MGTKSLARCHRVIIDDAEATKAAMIGVIMSPEGKGVEGIKPAVIRVESIVGPADLQFGWVRCHGWTLAKSFHAGQCCLISLGMPYEHG